MPGFLFLDCSVGNDRLFLALGIARIFADAADMFKVQRFLSALGHDDDPSVFQLGDRPGDLVADRIDHAFFADKFLYNFIHNT